MHENITKYLDFFSKNTLSKEELQEQINLFVRDFSAEELCNLHEQPQDGLFIIYFDKKDGLIIS